MSIEFTTGDRQSSTWVKVMERLTARLESLRKQNDNHAPPEVTAELRGRIAEVKALMALDKEPLHLPD